VAEAQVSPILIVGSPRSGTSVLTWALGQHPRILPLVEGEWLCKLAVNLPATYRLGVSRGEHSQFSSMGINPRDFYKSVGEAINRLLLDHRFEYERLRGERGSEAEKGTDGAYRISRSSDDPKVRYVDGTPEYSNHILALSWLFPEAKFIHLVRDARSVARSLVNFHRIGGPEWTPADAYQKWMAHVRACLEAELAFGSEVVLRVRHQDLMDSPEQALRRCLAFAGEEYSADCLRPLEQVINSSPVDAPGEAKQAGTVREAVVEEAIALSESVLAEKAPKYPPDDARLAQMENRLRNRLKGLEMMYAENLPSPERAST
jgi:Sulfotransferase family